MADGRLGLTRPCVIGTISRPSLYLNRCFRVTPKWLRGLLKMNRIADLKGCNYSVSREALFAINGFDEAYEGYGREDTDAELRFLPAVQFLQTFAKFVVRGPPFRVSLDCALIPPKAVFMARWVLPRA